ncbi:MAG: FAD-dependent oxidoreductase [Alteraurantiacibacter sp.]
MPHTAVRSPLASRRHVIGGAVTAAGLFALPGMVRGQSLAEPSLVPMRLTPDQLVDMKCCLRPLRAAGPNLGTETVGGKLVIHNYGHGGSGWSLSWGCAEVVVGKALAVLPRRVAVVGCGIIGLTSAIVAQRAGLEVTIYARDLIPRTRSFRASGSFTPGSRIALAGPAGADFPELWEQMARHSWRMFRTMLGLPGKPVEFGDSYAVSDTPIERRTFPADPAITDSYESTGLPHQNAEFAHLDSRIRDIVPQAVPLEPGEHPFGLPYATRSSQMHFNFPAYAAVLMEEFFGRGGRYVMRSFHRPAELADLPEDVVIHATGFAARDFWGDTTLIPVRGQTGWLVPQEGVNYGLRYRNISAMAKGDGIVIMNNNPDLGDMLGVGDSSEMPVRPPLDDAMATLAQVFANARQLTGARA